MKELFIPFKESQEMKELGFDEPCLATYHKELHTIIPIYAEYTNQDVNKAPTFSQAFKWFRDTHNLDAWVEEINHGINNDKKQYIFQLPTKTSHFEKIKYFETYEQAELECLRELIEIVKEQKK